MVGVIWLLAITTGSLQPPSEAADFYAILPHHVMVAVFGAVFGFALIAFGVGLNRFNRDARRQGRSAFGKVTAWRALRDVLTLKNLHAHGADCTYAGEELRSSLRRWFHHCTFYGFGLCFAATSVAAIYHWLGWPAPYGYGSLPVVLGTAGGFGLLIGPAGLYSIGRLRDPAAADPAYRYLEHGLIVLLFLSSVTGLALLVFRETPAMAYLLIVHLGIVLALFLTLPYGKFVHGLYRTAALVKHASES